MFNRESYRPGLVLVVVALLASALLATGCVWFAAGAAAGAVGATAAQDEDRDAGDVLSDAAITTRVKSALLASKKVHGSRIKVSVRLRVVTLRGVLPDEAEVAEALRIARAVDGVEEVVSKLHLD